MTEGTKATVTYYAYEFDGDNKLVWSSYPIAGNFEQIDEVYDAAEELVKQLLANADEQGVASRFEVSKPLIEEVPVG